MEKLRYCPECKEKNIFSYVERLQYEADRYWLFCTKRDDCTFVKEIKGKAVVTKEDLIVCGLPGQLLDHMDIFYEDINKIIRLCMYEYIKVKYLSYSTPENSFEQIKYSVRLFAESHGLYNLNPLPETAKTNESQAKTNEDLDGTVDDPCSLEFLSQNSLPIKPYEYDLSTAEKIPMDDEDLEQLLDQLLQPAKIKDDQILPTGSELLQPAEIKDGASLLLKDQGNDVVSKPKEVKKCPQSPKLFSSHDLMKRIADVLVPDLPTLYQEDIKVAFSKIEGYNFPEDFVNDTAPDKLPLLKILEEQQRQEYMKAETDAQLKDFVAEMSGLNILFN